MKRRPSRRKGRRFLRREKLCYFDGKGKLGLSPFLTTEYMPNFKITLKNRLILIFLKNFFGEIQRFLMLK